LTYKERFLLFKNKGGKFVKLDAPAAGEAFGRNYPARGLAVGDLDNDGIRTLSSRNSGEAPLVLRNTRSAEGANGWIGLQLGADATGALITWSADRVKRSRLKTSGGSYLSAHDPRELLGLGPAKKADWLEVRWPAPRNRVDRFQNVAAGKYYALRPGGALQ